MTTPDTSDSNEILSKELVVQNKMGIHARPAAMIVRIANTYSGEVWVDKDDEQVNQRLKADDSYRRASRNRRENASRP
jgi:phosphocarrier protein